MTSEVHLATERRASAPLEVMPVPHGEDAGGRQANDGRRTTMSELRRRQLVLGGAAATAVAVGGTASPALASEPRSQRPFRPPAGPRYRLISDNDYSGDPDGLYQLVHHLLSPSVDVRAAIGSHLAPGDPFDPSTQQATNAYRRILEVLRLMGLTGRVPTYQGSNAA